MTTRTRDRLMYGGLAVATIAIGLLVHLRGTALNADVRDVLGDALWAGMMLWLVSAVAPAAARAARGGVALAICFTVELSQLIHSPAIDALRATLFGRLVLGSGFDARDLAAYAVGVAAALVVERVAWAAFFDSR